MVNIVASSAGAQEKSRMAEERIFFNIDFSAFLLLFLFSAPGFFFEQTSQSAERISQLCKRLSENFADFPLILLRASIVH
jgi:hypothetical protein